MIKLYYLDKQVVAVADETCAVYYNPNIGIIEKEFETQIEVDAFITDNNLESIETHG